MTRLTAECMSYSDHIYIIASSNADIGRNYVDEQTSIAQNLTYASHNTFILRTDNKAILNATGLGRNSVRILTKNEYATHVSVYVALTTRAYEIVLTLFRFDVRHMPQGCG